MNRLFGALIFVLLFGSLSACVSDDSNPAENMISTADINDREETILSTTADEAFLFDYRTTYDEVTVWVEKYEHGELADDRLGLLTTQTDEKGSIILATTPNQKESGHPFSIGIGDKNGTASSTVLDENFEDAGDFASKVFGALPEEETLDDGEIVLADIAYVNDESSINSISDTFYEDPKAHLDVLKEYDVVYLFKAIFTNE